MSYDKLVEEKEQLETKLIEVNEKIKLTTEYQQFRKIEIKEILDDIKSSYDYGYIFSNYLTNNWNKLANVDIIKDCKYKYHRGYGDTKSSSDNKVIIEYIDGHKLTIIYYLAEYHEHEELNMTLICPIVGKVECLDLDDKCDEEIIETSNKLNKCIIGQMINYYEKYIEEKRD